MTSDHKYGSREGLADRLDAWIHRLGTDKSLPWVGLGLIADLKAARGFVDLAASLPADRKLEARLPEKLKEKIVEFDL